MSVNFPQPSTAKIQDLHPAPYNPREMPEVELERLIRSIMEFGFVEPVVGRKEDGLLIGGHQRLEALKLYMRRQSHTDEEIAATMVPVVWLEGLTDERAKLLNLALNKIGGEWDYEKLAEVFASLSELDEEEMGLSGFSVNEIEDVVGEMGTEDADGEGEEIDVDQELAEKARKFAFMVDTDAEARLCHAVLRAHGMTGAANAGQAFVQAMATAADAKKVTAADPVTPDLSPPAKHAKVKLVKGKKGGSRDRSH